MSETTTSEVNAEEANAKAENVKQKTKESGEEEEGEENMQIEEKGLSENLKDDIEKVKTISVVNLEDTALQNPVPIIGGNVCESETSSDKNGVQEVFQKENQIQDFTATKTPEKGENEVDTLVESTTITKTQNTAEEDLDSNTAGGEKLTETTVKVVEAKASNVELLASEEKNEDSVEKSKISDENHAVTKNIDVEIEEVTERSESPTIFEISSEKEDQSLNLIDEEDNAEVTEEKIDIQPDTNDVSIEAEEGKVESAQENLEEQKSCETKEELNEREHFLKEQNNTEDTEEKIDSQPDTNDVSIEAKAAEDLEDKVEAAQENLAEQKSCETKEQLIEREQCLKEQNNTEVTEEKIDNQPEINNDVSIEAKASEDLVGKVEAAQESSEVQNSGETKEQLNEGEQCLKELINTEVTEEKIHNQPEINNEVSIEAKASEDLEGKVEAAHENSEEQKSGETKDQLNEGEQCLKELINTKVTEEKIDSQPDTNDDSIEAKAAEDLEGKVEAAQENLEEQKSGETKEQLNEGEQCLKELINTEVTEEKIDSQPDTYDDSIKAKEADVLEGKVEAAEENLEEQKNYETKEQLNEAENSLKEKHCSQVQERRESKTEEDALVEEEKLVKEPAVKERLENQESTEAIEGNEKSVLSDESVKELLKKPTILEIAKPAEQEETSSVVSEKAKEDKISESEQAKESNNMPLATKDKEQKEASAKTMPSKNVNEIMAVIEIDDENENESEEKLQKVDETKKGNEVSKEIKAAEQSSTAVESGETLLKDNLTKAANDVIEIDDDDDDDDDTDPRALKIDENSVETTNDETKKTETKADEAAMETTEIIELTVEEPISKEVETKSSEKATGAIAKMHTMPMIYYKQECINFECPKTHKEFHRAPQFALNYFKISKKKMKMQYICGDCYDMTLNFYQDFCGILEAKQPILMKTIANKKQEFVEILDSSDEDEGDAVDTENKEQENPSFSQADLDLIEAELDNTIRKVFDRVDIQNQLTWTKTIFTQRVQKLQSELEYIDAELGETQKIADRMYNDLYDSGKYRINNLTPLDLDNDTEQIPPYGEVERPAIKLGAVYFAARSKAIGCWVPCKVIEQVEFVPHYRVKFLNAQFQPFKNISAKLIAYYDAPKVRLAVGQRVIAYFDGSTLSATDKEKNIVKSAFYPGIIAEEMKPNNFYRYLIFYDDGYTQYVSCKDVRLVCNVARNVWEDVDHVSREFIKKYVQEYRVNRPMVQTHKGQKMSTEKNGRWVQARVIDIDCSLVRMQFESPKGNHTEWIYRGSLRLYPVYMEYQKSKNKNATERVPVSRLPRRTEPFIRYTDDEENLNAQQQQQQQISQRTLNRSNSTSSTTSSTAASTTVRHLNANTIYLEDEKPKGKVIYYTAKRQMPTRVYKKHECGPHCLIVIPHNLNGYNPLAKPLLSGWERLFLRQKIKKTVHYRAPCGKTFRNMRELHHFLRITKCNLNVDNFDYYPETSCLAEFEAENVHLKKRDISNGQEKMPLPLINYYDDTLPECTYSAKVIPTEGVNINTDTNFLVCCDCEDDCVDKSKCACWKLTVEGVRTVNPNLQLDEIGYQYKRLYEHLPTGIYECNSRCKCKSHCLNRVVQHSLGLKLQVFKTTNRGWGLRCLNDIPRGSFVCVYAGNLLTEAKANEGGLDAGDEYFAELDYIETVEQLKEGYESDIETQEEEDDEDAYEPEPEDDVDFQPSKSTELRLRRGTASVGSNSEGERQAINFNPKIAMADDSKKKRHSVRTLFGKDEAVYVMDAKVTGNLGRYFNHSCSPNLFVQNVFVDTHDIRFPTVAFFSLIHIRAGTELTWNYNYEVGVVPGKVLYCQCGAVNCRQRLL